MAVCSIYIIALPFYVKLFFEMITLKYSYIQYITYVSGISSFLFLVYFLFILFWRQEWSAAVTNT